MAGSKPHTHTHTHTHRHTHTRRDTQTNNHCVVANLDGVSHEMTGHVVDFVIGVVLPPLVANSVHLTHALCGLRFLIQLFDLGSMLLPAVQPETMYLQHTPPSDAMRRSDPYTENRQMSYAIATWYQRLQLERMNHTSIYPYGA